MRKYFISGKEYKFQNKTFNANWIFSGSQIRKSGKLVNIYLPKIAWISSESYVKVAGNISAYDSNHVYWAQRNSRYSSLSTRVNNLLKRQLGKCATCKRKFQLGDHMEVDHIIPRSKGGLDRYDNLQLLHRQCHTKKTAKDLGNPKTSARKILQEPDEGKLSRPVLKTR